MVGVRKRFRKLFSATMALAMILSLFSTAVFAASDTKGHWAEKEINKWVSQGLVGGYSDGSFKPNAPISRAEFIALVNRSFGFSEASETGFSDVSANDWYYSEVLKAKAAGYIGGYEDGTIKPNNKISRQEVAAILSRLVGADHNESAADQFTDKGSIPGWSKGIIGGVVAEGLMKGFDDGTFKPLNNTTRAEAVVILDRSLGQAKPASNETVLEQAGTYGPEQGIETIEGNVVVTAAGVTLRNTVIAGDLTIAKEVGEGEVFLKGVTVKGKTYVNGGGENSIHFEDTVLLTVIVNKADGTVRIVATGKTTVQEVTLQSSAKVEQTGSEGVAFRTVTLAEALPANSQVTLVGNFENVDIQAATIAVTIPRGSIQNLMVAADATGTSLNLSQDAKIVSLVLDAVAKVLGAGVIETASGKGAKESSYEKAPNKVEGTTTTTGGGGGGGGSSSDDSGSTTTNATITLKVTSTAFQNNGEIAEKYTHGGRNISLPISWTKVEAAKSYALLMYDPDADDFIHWMVKDIPANVISLGEGISKSPSMPGVELTSFFNEKGYSGPEPPEKHTYKIIVYALNQSSISINDKIGGVPKADFDAAINGKVIAKSELTGTFDPSKVVYVETGSANGTIAGNGEITGVTPGTKYVVRHKMFPYDPNPKYYGVQADGTLGALPQALNAGVTKITGLTNNNSYQVVPELTLLVDQTIATGDSIVIEANGNIETNLKFFNGDINESALRSAIEFASDGVNFNALSSTDTIEMVGNKITIKFATPLNGSNNKVKIAANTFKGQIQAFESGMLDVS